MNDLAVVVGMYREILNIDVAFGIFVHKERGNIIVIGGSGTNAASACSLKIKRKQNRQ